MKNEARRYKKALKTIIERDVFVRSSDRDITLQTSRGITSIAWLFDFKQVLLEGSVLHIIVELFLHHYKHEDHLQIGGLESTSLPLIAGIVQEAHKRGKDYSGFFIRKGRKKTGLMNIVEGTVYKDKKIVLVDDLINSSKTFIKQVETLEELGHTVTATWTILRFRDYNFYSYFHDKGIRVESFFCLDDFSETLGVKNMPERKSQTPIIPYTPLWKFAAPNPSYFHVVPKSDPAIDNTKIYTGADNGTFWALNQRDGSVAWSRKIGFHPKGKGIFSSPTVLDNTVYFGAYDGNVYALDTETGKPRWIFFEADWIGSSPAISKDLGLLFIGLEFGLIRKRGGIAAIDVKTGEKRWHNIMPTLTHSTPLYIKEREQVIIGSNDGCAYLFNAKNGDLVWQFETETPSNDEMGTEFSAHDIKESFAYDRKRDYLVFGNQCGTLFILARKTGKEVSRFQADFGFYSTPLIYENKLYASSLDKHLYCFDLERLEGKWKWSAGARIFASPVAIEESIYIGANTGRLTELNPETGEERSFLPLTERITNKPAYNLETKHFFVPTFANELYCVERTGKKKRLL